MGRNNDFLIMQGIKIDNSKSPRSLLLDGEQVAVGGNANTAGLYAVGGKLYLDGQQIAESADGTGILRKTDGLYFGKSKVGSSEPIPPTPQSGLWIPPTQEASTYNKYNYSSIIEAYDDLKDNSNYPGTITKHRYSEDGYGDYPLWHYEFTPANYAKTFYVEATIHGNEKDAAQTLLRIMDIICNHCNESAYSRLAQLRDNVRFIVVPIVSPWGFDHSYMNVPYTDRDGVSSDMNPNRNADFNHEYQLNQGNGGNYPWQIAETRHVKHIIDTIGIENIDYLVDYHDGGGVNQHFWVNYNRDGANAPVMSGLISDLIDYEEELIADGGTDYRNNGQWVIDNCYDAAPQGTGIMAAWFNNTLGALGSVCEYMGGYFGYSFSAEQMTRSLRIRGNLLIYAYEKLATKGWRVNEAADADYFQFDYPISATRQGLRQDGTISDKCENIVTYDDVYERWDALVSAHPSYVTKSALLGHNTDGDDVYSYTLGSGSKKVLFIGGPMRWNRPHKETEFGIYILAEYLCNDYIVNQSKFLKKIKQEYSVVVLPCIDIKAGGNAAGIYDYSLNTNGTSPGSTYAKWRIVDGKCEPSSHGDECADVSIFKAWIAANTDASALVSGGEDVSGYSLELPRYNQNFMTQFVLPLNQQTPQWLEDYCDWLENARGEDAPDVEKTNGMTSGDYAFDNFHIPTYYINLKVSQMWAERQQYAQSGDSADKYMYRTYETGRRIANIANFILMAGGDIL